MTVQAQGQIALTAQGHHLAQLYILGQIVRTGGGQRICAGPGLPAGIILAAVILGLVACAQAVLVFAHGADQIQVLPLVLNLKQGFIYHMEAICILRIGGLCESIVHILHGNTNGSCVRQILDLDQLILGNVDLAHLHITAHIQAGNRGCLVVYCLHAAAQQMHGDLTLVTAVTDGAFDGAALNRQIGNSIVIVGEYVDCAGCAGDLYIALHEQCTKGGNIAAVFGYTVANDCIALKLYSSQLINAHIAALISGGIAVQAAAGHDEFTALDIHTAAAAFGSIAGNDTAGHFHQTVADISSCAAPSCGTIFNLTAFHTDIGICAAGSNCAAGGCATGDQAALHVEAAIGAGIDRAACADSIATGKHAVIQGKYRSIFRVILLIAQVHQTAALQRAGVLKITAVNIQLAAAIAVIQVCQSRIVLYFLALCIHCVGEGAGDLAQVITLIVFMIADIHRSVDLEHTGFGRNGMSVQAQVQLTTLGNGDAFRQLHILGQIVCAIGGQRICAGPGPPVGIVCAAVVLGLAACAQTMLMIAHGADNIQVISLFPDHQLGLTYHMEAICVLRIGGLCKSIVHILHGNTNGCLLGQILDLDQLILGNVDLAHLHITAHIQAGNRGCLVVYCLHAAAQQMHGDLTLVTAVTDGAFDGAALNRQIGNSIVIVGEYVDCAGCAGDLYIALHEQCTKGGNIAAVFGYTVANDCIALKLYSSQLINAHIAALISGGIAVQAAAGHDEFTALDIHTAAAAFGSIAGNDTAGHFHQTVADISSCAAPSCGTIFNLTAFHTDIGICAAGSNCAAGGCATGDQAALHVEAAIGAGIDRAACADSIATGKHAVIQGKYRSIFRVILLIAQVHQTAALQRAGVLKITAVNIQLAAAIAVIQVCQSRIVLYFHIALSIHGVGIGAGELALVIALGIFVVADVQRSVNFENTVGRRNCMAV